MKKICMSSPVSAKMGVMVRRVYQMPPGVRVVLLPSELKQVLALYFHTPLGTLIDRDRRDQLQRDRAIRYDLPDGPPSTAPNLFEQLQWCQVHQTMERLKERKVFVSGVQIPGWYHYVLACWVGAQKPLDTMPQPELKHRAAAIKAVIKELQKWL
jgi:hypothetical protein